MKKFVSLFLTVIMVLSAFSFTAFAEGSKTEAFLNEVISSKTLSFYCEDIASADLPISIDRVSFKVKIDNDGFETIFGTMKIGFIEIPIYVTEDSAYVYFPLFRVKLDLFELINPEDIAEEMDVFFGGENFVDSIYATFSGELISSKETEIDGLGNVTVEDIRMTPQSLLNRYVSAGYIELPDGVDAYSLSDIEATAFIVDGLGFEAANNVLKSYRQICFDKDDNIVEIYDYYYECDGTVTEYSIRDDAGLGNLKVSTGLTDKDFAEPMFYIDITGFLKTVMFLSMLEI